MEINNKHNCADNNSAVSDVKDKLPDAIEVNPVNDPAAILRVVISTG